MAGISIPINADEDGAVRGVKNVAAELDKVADSLDDMARDGDKATEKLEASFKEVARAARNADDDVEKIGTGGFKRVSEAAGEFKDEARQNFGEVASSFTGEMGSIQDVAQGTLGGLASTLTGPLGLAAGGAALAVGAIGTALGAVEEQRAQLAEKAGELAQAYIDAGTNVLDAITLASRTTDVLTDPERRKEAEKLATLLGDDLPLATRVLAGDTRALADAQRFAQAQENELNELGLAAIVQSSRRKTENDALKTSHEELTTILEREATVQEMATETARAQSNIFLEMINSTRGVTEEVDELGNRLYTLPDGKQIMIDAETGIASANVDGFKGDLDGIPRNVTTTVRATADVSAVTRAIDNINGRTVYVRVAADGRRGRPFE